MIRHVAVIGTNDKGEHTCVETFNGSTVKVEVCESPEQARCIAEHMVSVYGAQKIVSYY